MHLMYLNTDLVSEVASVVVSALEVMDLHPASAVLEAVRSERIMVRTLGHLKASEETAEKEVELGSEGINFDSALSDI